MLVATSSAFSLLEPFPLHPASQLQNSHLHASDNSTQSKLDEMQRRLDESELDRLIELDNQRAAAEDAKEATLLEAEEAQATIKLEAEERAKLARQEAEDRGVEIEDRKQIASASKRTSIYEALAFLAFMFVSYKIVRDKRNSKENALKPHEKTGVVIGITGVAILLCALSVSSPWIPQMDFWQNLMQDFMTIDFWPYVHTKFIILPCIGLMLYGALVYLEIFKAPKPLLSPFE